MKKILRLIDLAVRKKGLLPRFYVIGGSDIYGFKSDVGSDIDVRGFHIAPSEDFFKLDPPEEQIIVNQGKLTKGFEDFKDIELVSYELRKFGAMVNKMNFNVLEWLFCGKGIMNGIPLMIEGLKDEVKNNLPSSVPYHYFAMAKQNYYKFLNKDKESYRPEAKKYLYVLRGLLAADHVYHDKDIQSDVRELAEENGLLITELIAVKRQGENVQLPQKYIYRAERLIKSLTKKAMDYKKEPTHHGLSDYINKWMVSLRSK